MNKKENIYDDGNIPEVDLPTHLASNTETKNQANIEPLPEATRPRKDGPGGE